MIKRARGRIYKTTKGMNGLEREYASQLDLRRHGGDVCTWLFESVKLKLADNTHYTPDFMVQLADGTIEFHETKGFWRDDARVKLKVAAERYPMFPFVVVQKVKGKLIVTETFNK